MADSFSAQLKGLSQVEDRLEMLGAIAGAKVMRTVLYAAAKPLYEQTIANIRSIPNGSGALAKSVRRVYLKPGTRSSFTAIPAGPSRFVIAIAPKAKDRVAIALANLYYKRKVKGVFWGHLLEWGHRIGNKSTGYLTRATTTRGLKRTRLHGGLGRVPGKRVFTRAAETRADDAIRIFEQQIGRAIDRALKKQ